MSLQEANSFSSTNVNLIQSSGLDDSDFDFSLCHNYGCWRY